MRTERGLRARLFASLAVATGALASAAGCGGEARVFDRPDVILVVIDTWRWDAFGANVGRPELTPNLDELAAGGVRFHRAFASSPWTASSVGTMFTGRYPTIHGSYGPVGDVAPLREGVPTMAEVLRAGGYHTVAAVNGFFLSPKFAFHRGFDVYDFVPSSNKKIRRAGPTVDDALALLRRERNEGPVFFFLHVFDPHLAYDPPPPWNRRWTDDYRGRFADLNSMRRGLLHPDDEQMANIRGLYDGEVGYTDHALGRFFRGLDEVLPGRERLILVTSDHGEEFGEHGGWEHGQAMYRELVQVPLIVVPPASRPASRHVVEAQVRLLDLMPTVLEVARVPMVDTLPGTSLFPWFEGTPVDDDLLAYSEREHLGKPSASVRDGTHALIFYPEEDRAELFDQRDDPLETRDVAAEHPQRVDTLRARLDALRADLERNVAELAEREKAELDQEELDRMESLGY